MLPGARPGPSHRVLECSFPEAGALFSHTRRAPTGSMSSLGRSEAAEQTLLVGNLESRVREEILYELFLQAGPLTKVMICEDKEGKPNSFGYVCFKHKVSVPYAKALLDGICLYGRPITVQYWRGNSPSPELDNCADGFEHHIDLESLAERHQELSGNSPFPVTPLPVDNSLLHDHPGFQEVNQDCTELP
ncbi:splicing regulator RBM11 [Onychostruthus taczanowskii]|uniref:splicing regulator RBM11 n=1 Tax=Onychostruthus taczanowskii TaxID=356909 RepID=UPI001B800C9F|nr:splicing regulator RBM11 [Onychostruthus taczanowskii]